MNKEEWIVWMMFCGTVAIVLFGGIFGGLDMKYNWTGIWS